MRIYYGWHLVAASLLILTLVLGSTFHSFGVFVTPVSAELGLSRAEANTGLILFNLGGAVFAPIMGKLLDRMPIQRIMLVCAVLMGASMATLGLSHSLWLSGAVLAAPLALAAQGGTISATTLIARWFSVHRGRAMAIALFGMSLAGILVTPAIAYGVEAVQWRMTLVIAGAALTVLLLAIALVIREKPGPNDVESKTQGAGADAAHAAPPADAKPLNAVSILAMPQFWTIGLSCGTTLAFTSAVMVTLVPLAEGAGAPPTQAASLVAILAAAGFVGGLVVAWISDRVDRMLLLAAMFVIVAAVNALFYFSGSFALLALAAALLGLSTGIASPAYHALIADRFGAASFGTAYGLMSLLMTVISAAAVRFAGEVFDRTGSYHWLFLTIVVLQLIAAVLIFGTRMLLVPRAAAVGAQAAH